MSNLIVSGNTNPYTFANSIVAAEGKSVQVFGEGLDWIYVLHSSESLPAMLRLRPVAGAVPRQFEVAEILDLQAMREQARTRR